MNATLKLHSLSFTETKTYLAAALFVIGNIIFPQLCHLLPYGGPMWLPIYFFTLVGAYKYGWRVGLLTAIASPVANSLLFGMPAITVVPAIIIKSVILAVTAGYFAYRFKKATLGLMIAVVLSYQLIGTIGEWIITSDFNLAIQDFRIGIPGMFLQILGGWLFINHLIRN